MMVAISRNARRPTRKDRIASRRRSFIGQAQTPRTQLSAQEAVLCDQVRERRSLSTLKPAGENHQQSLRKKRFEPILGRHTPGFLI